MPVTAEQPAPYAPASGILDLIKRHRDKGLPSPVNADVLQRAGISESLISRTLQALTALDLVDDDGKPTAVLEGIRLAPESEYKQRLADWLTEAYADALQYIDPATADETEIRDAFRSYKPVGMQPRMVTLFMGLFSAAGVRPERERQRQAPNRTAKAPPPRQKPSNPKPSSARQDQNSLKTPNGDLPPALAGLLTSLPLSGEGWTKDQRDRFRTTFDALLDFYFPVTKRAKQEAFQDEEEDIDQ